MIKMILTSITIFMFATACQSTSNKTSTIPEENNPLTVSCKDPRPEICTQEYVPVCATKDTGVRCVTTPCPSTEKVTYPNACSACADKKVYSHVLGTCESR